MKIKSLIFSTLIFVSFSASASVINNSALIINKEETLYDKMQKIDDAIWKTSLCIYSNSETDRILTMEVKLNILIAETKKIHEFYQSKIEIALAENNQNIVQFLNKNIKDTKIFNDILIDLQKKFSFFINKNDLKNKLDFNCSDDKLKFLENGNIFHFYDEIKEKNDKLMEVTENIFNFSKQRIYVEKFEDVKYLYTERKVFDLTNIELFNMSRMLDKMLSEVKDMIDIILDPETSQEEGILF
ncbi:hypothetical protein QEJ31_11695 [Pigmentibacter sp. JX0631]|uniref:hypothetical protein n=1 Tax=Pigmentibacter sp. JX0631 TaxID=2976982 RepID=UPI00246839A5|nr:hypothetical protein [Pigmentibacter sp. JX0631]WGL59184.1 hypothetical protein QEJ31_11695 [Pigmentibacter sp. JX0631]